MKTMQLAGVTVKMDDEGYMTDPSEWTEAVAAELAKEEGIATLTDRHWAVIHFCRKDFAEKGETPGLRRISKESGVDTKELYALFPQGPAKKVARIAGLGKPKGCV